MRQIIPGLTDLALEGENQAEKLGFVTKMAGDKRLVHNNSVDAFRHAYVSAKITRDSLGGRYVARAKGDFVEQNGEWFQNQSADERQMDEHNNAIGEEIGEVAKREGWSDDQIAEAVKKAILQGQLILRPGQSAGLPSPEDIPYQNRLLPQEPRRGSSINWPGDRAGPDGGAVLVHPYERDSGPVRGHYRSRP